MGLERIGRYEIQDELGRGGMATVFRAHDPSFDRDVAIKVLPPEFLHDPTFRARFEREARTVAALEHAAIVPVYDFGEEGGQPFLVMRYMDGGSLADRIAKGPLPINGAAEILRRIGSALDCAHRQGIIHRDLKPRNILFDRYDDAYLADFGIAKIAEAGATLTGSAVIGTPAYLSPEQARGASALDGRSDIYALGTILFEMLTGQPPYDAGTPLGLAIKHLSEPVPRILDVKPDLPSGCESVISQAMAKDRDKRFSTAGEMAEVFWAVTEDDKLAQPSGRLATATTRSLAESQLRPPVREAATPAPEATTTRRVSPLRWLLVAVPAVLVLIAAGAVALSGVIGTASEPTSVPSLVPLVATATPTVSATPVPAPTETPVPTASPTDRPTSTIEIPTPVPTRTPVPTPTSIPTPTAIPTGSATPACVYDVELVEVQDPYLYWYVNSHPSFGLVLRNNGTCPWSDGTTLLLVSENVLGWPESWAVESTDPDQTATIDIQLTAPSTPQTLLIVWQLQGPQGELIGAEITRTLRIELRPTATPPTPQPQEPTSTQSSAPPPDAPTSTPGSSKPPKSTPRPPKPPTNTPAPHPSATPPPP